MTDDDAYGFIVVDGRGTLFATVRGSRKEIAHRFGVDLPKKHGRGGQSANRFERLGQEKRHNYVRKVAETAKAIFVGPNGKTNVKGIVLAGSADLKTVLGQSNLFARELKEIIVATVDVSYGGAAGLNEAIEAAKDVLGSLRLVKEKELLKRYFDEIASDSGLVCFGAEDTMAALEMGAVKTLICWDELALKRIMMKKDGGTETVVEYRTTASSAQDNEIISAQPLLDWLMENAIGFGADMEIVSNSSQEGNQFAAAFDGIGGFLRYRIDFDSHDNAEDEFDLNEY